MSKLNAYVLLSGGLDSSALLAFALSLNYNVTAVSFKYGQRHGKEIEHASKVAGHFKVPHHILDITTVIGIGGLTDKDLQIPNVSYAELPAGMSPTYVPFRNGLMLSIITSLASAKAHVLDEENEEMQSVVMYGAHVDDAAGDAYPDCSQEFIAAMNNAIQIGTYRKVSLKAPFKAKTKAHIVRIGNDAQLPFELTWSCYNGGEVHCGTCPTCRARKEAFVTAKVVDPTTYEDSSGIFTQADYDAAYPERAKARREAEEAAKAKAEEGDEDGE